MRVALGTIDVSDYVRAALNYHYGESGLASRERVRTFILSNGMIALEDDLTRTYDERETDGA